MVGQVWWAMLDLKQLPLPFQATGKNENAA